MGELFWEIHSGNPREGPREFQSTKRAFDMLKDLPSNPRILDIGCGPGTQTIDLSLLTDGTIIAIDNHPQFLEDLDGSQLVQAGIEILKRRGYPFIIVLGHPEYYPRFGFKRASVHGIRSQWEGVPDEAFMILILNDEAMFGACGVARYRNEFDEAM